jgi:hypothetical protein
MFYAGEASVVQMRAFGGYGWDRATELVDRCLASTSTASTCAPATT